MTFSNIVKSELISAVTDNDKRFACLYGMLVFCNKFDEKEICFQSENVSVANFFEKLVLDVFKKSIHFNKDIIERKNGTTLYSYTLNDIGSCKKVAELFRISNVKREIHFENIDNNSLPNFIAGIFLGCGSVTNPENEYHLEFVIPSEQLNIDMLSFFTSLELKPKSLVRKNSYVLYFKESESIEDILTFMGAQNATLDIMNIKIFKDVRNRVNRVRNCDIANCNKISNASAKQLQDIKLIMEENKFDTLPATLREIAHIRLQNPECSLNELGELLNPPIGRSGVNHRFQRIKQIADQIRNREESDERICASSPSQ